VKLGSYMGWFDHWMVRLHNYSTSSVPQVQFYTAGSFDSSRVTLDRVLLNYLYEKVPNFYCRIVVYTRLLNVEGSCNLSTALDSLFHLCPSSLLSYPDFHVLATAPVFFHSISTLYLLVYSLAMRGFYSITIPALCKSKSACWAGLL
jgi:hypothetical protein